MLPFQSVTIKQDIYSGTFGLFSATTTVPRYIIYTNYLCNPITRDNHVVLGYNIAQPNNNNIIDTESMASVGGNFQNTLWNTGTALYWSKPTTGDKCFFMVTYIDVASTTTATTEVASTTMPYTYHDWLFVSGVEIFFLSFIGISMIFSAFKRRT
jgi:hypothetical protein